MGIVQHVRPAVRQAFRADWTQVSLATGVRNAIGVFLPLAVGAMVGETTAGLTASIGALNIAFLDRPAGYRLRLEWMSAAALWAAVSVFVGLTTSGHLWLSLPAIVVWAMVAGLSTSLGPNATQMTVTGVILLLVYGNFSLDPRAAAQQSVLLLAGALFQTLLSVAAWPFLRRTPERRALAAAFRALEGLATSLPSDHAAPPASPEMTAAATLLLGPARSRSDESDTLRVLLDEAERIRVELIALKRLEAIDARDDAVDRSLVSRYLAATSDVLSAIAQGLDTGHPPLTVDEVQRRLDRAARIDAVSSPRAALLAPHLSALAGQLRACIDLVAGDADHRRPGVSATRRLTTSGSWEVLRANLNWRAASMRHAIRLAACLAVSELVAAMLGVGRAYWVPMTVAIVLRPDFGSTVSRGIARIIGTLAGLAVATILVWAFFRSEADRVVLVGLLTLFIRTMGPVNFGVSAAAITSLVVVLISFQGVASDQVLLERGADTLLGGALALVSYVVFPTWERTQIPVVLAELLDAYRDYIDAVFIGPSSSASGDTSQVHALRLAARLARSNAEASLDRARDEPHGSDGGLEWAERLLASSNRFINAMMALEALQRENSSAAVSSSIRGLAGDMAALLGSLAVALRSGTCPATEDVPDLLDPYPDLHRGYGGASDVVRDEVERAASSLATMVHIVRGASLPGRASGPVGRAVTAIRHGVPWPH